LKYEANEKNVRRISSKYLGVGTHKFNDHMQQTMILFTPYGLQLYKLFTDGFTEEPPLAFTDSPNTKLFLGGAGHCVLHNVKNY